MWVKLKDGEHRCVTNEFDVADIVERYCGKELAELIRECEYTNIVNNCIDVIEQLSKVYVCNGEEAIITCVEDAMLSLEEYI